MTVKDAIEILESYPPEMKLLAHCVDMEVGS